MKDNLKNIGRWAGSAGYPRWQRFALVLSFSALVLTLAFLLLAPASSPATESGGNPGKVLEELNYQVDVFIWRDALRAKMVFREVGGSRYRAELDGRSQGLLSMLTGSWRGAMSTEMEYSQGKLQPLVYREISYKSGTKRVMEYRFDYAQKKVELWKQEGDKAMEKRWETALNGPMYDPLTFFYNRRLTGGDFGEKGGESVKIQSIPYPKPDEITMRVGDQTEEGRKIMLEMGNRLFKDERSQIYAILDSEGVPTKAWTTVMKFGNVDIKLLPGSKRLKKEEVTGPPSQARACQN